MIKLIVIAVFFSMPATIAHADSLALSGTYASIKANIIDTKCVACHGASGSGGVSLTTYEGVTAILQPGNAVDSTFYTAITRTDGVPMPMSGTRLSASEVEDVKTWIDEGAKDE